jgi:flavin-dependent dehydrogenase
MVETRPYDAIVLGGGLAGLTFARQLLLQRPETRILVLEKRAFPVSEASYKVGESTVEIGAHYLADVVQLKKHLVDAQLPKFGLRFFFNGGHEALSDGTEVGTSEFFAAPGYQVDRGRLENYLASAVVDSGAEFLTRAKVRSFQLNDSATNGASHRIHFRHEDTDHVAACRWIVDASGRAGFLKRHLQLAEPIDHIINAVWFRIGAEIKVDEWSNNREWRSRTGKLPRRWLSTNHLLGRGYWVWIIPLASGATSIGIVADPRVHPLSEINRFEKAVAWLQKHEPLCGTRVAAHQDKLQDFCARKRLGYGCRQVFSANRWAITGEAGVFLDPLYSPGIDYIALANTMICRLVQADGDGQSLEQLAPRLESTFMSLFQDNVLTYKDQYPLFGNPRAMSLKYVWDYAVYWSFPALLFFNDKLTDPTFLQSLTKDVDRLREMNRSMQKFFREWDDVEGTVYADAAFVDQHKIGILTQLNAELRDRLDDATLRARFHRNVDVLDELMTEIVGRVQRSRPESSDGQRDLPAAKHRLDGVFDALNL